jgi:hypothetical protein
VVTIILSACAHEADRHGTTDASRAAAVDASIAPGMFVCPTGTPETVACADTTQFCYAGDELQFYQGPGVIQVGCNELPAGAMPTCESMSSLFAAGFCTCSESGGGVVMLCSFV